MPPASNTYAEQGRTEIHQTMGTFDARVGATRARSIVPKAGALPKLLHRSVSGGGKIGDAVSQVRIGCLSLVKSGTNDGFGDTPKTRAHPLHAENQQLQPSGLKFVKITA